MHPYLPLHDACIVPSLQPPRRGKLYEADDDALAADAVLADKAAARGGMVAMLASSPLRRTELAPEAPDASGFEGSFATGTGGDYDNDDSRTRWQPRARTAAADTFSTASPPVMPAAAAAAAAAAARVRGGSNDERAQQQQQQQREEVVDAQSAAATRLRVHNKLHALGHRWGIEMSQGVLVPTGDGDDHGGGPMALTHPGGNTTPPTAPRPKTPPSTIITEGQALEGRIITSAIDTVDITSSDQVASTEGTSAADGGGDGGGARRAHAWLRGKRYPLAVVERMMLALSGAGYTEQEYVAELEAMLQDGSLAELISSVEQELRRDSAAGGGRAGTFRPMREDTAVDTTTYSSGGGGSVVDVAQLNRRVGGGSGTSDQERIRKRSTTAVVPQELLQVDNAVNV